MDEHMHMFKKAAENFSLAPPAHIWSNVEKDILNRKRKKRFLLFFFTGVALLISGIVFLQRQTVTLNNKTAVHNNPEQNIITQQQTQQNISVLKNNAVKNTSSATVSETETHKQNVALSKQANVPAMQSLPVLPLNKHTSLVVDTNVAMPVSTADNIVNTESDNTIPPVEFPELADSSTLTIAIPIDTVLPKKDTLVTALIDTIKKDSVVTTDSVKAASKKIRWHLEASFAPAISYTPLKEEGDYRFIANYRDSTDKNLVTFNYRLAVHYTVIPAMDVFTGLGIVNMKQEMLSSQAVYGWDTIITPASGPLGGDTTYVLGKKVFHINNDSTGTVTNRFTYIQLPVGISYRFLEGSKFTMALRPVIAFNKLASFNSYIYNYKTYAYEKAKSADLTTWIISYGAGISIEYAIHKNLAIALNTNYNRYAKSIYTSAYPISQRFDQLEFGLALRYGLK